MSIFQGGTWNRYNESKYPEITNNWIHSGSNHTISICNTDAIENQKTGKIPKLNGDLISLPDTSMVQGGRSAMQN